jgi:hypothetical protein
MSSLIFLLTGFIAFIILKTIVQEEQTSGKAFQPIKFTQFHKSVLIGCAVGMILCGIGMLSLATVGNPLIFQLTAFTSLFFWSLTYKVLSTLTLQTK